MSMNTNQFRRTLPYFGFILILLGMLPGIGAAQPLAPNAQKDDLLMAIRPPRLAVPDTRSAPLTSASADSRPDDWVRMIYEGLPRGTDYDIFYQNGLVTDRTPLASSPADEIQPRLNHHATAVIFTSSRDSNYEIYQINVDNSRLTRLTSNTAADAFPAWSPGDDRIAFASLRDTNWNIYVMSVYGGAATPLTSDSADDIMPAWSPDGKTIAWVRRIQLTPTSFERRLWLMDANGANPRPISGPLPDLQHPAWSPDGRQIAFDYDADGNGWNELALVNADGSGLRIIADAKQQMREIWMGSWMPDGTSLVYDRLDWLLYLGQLNIANTALLRLDISNNAILGQLFVNYATSIDLQSADPDPPHSHVQALPEYSRAGGFPVQWGGYDQGPSGIVGADVQYRVGADAWTTWQQPAYFHAPTIAGTATFVGTPGSTIAFRSRTLDEASNQEAWPSSAGETSTTLYTAAIAGTVTDNRENLLPQAPLLIAPQLLNSTHTDNNGEYRGYAKDASVHTVGIEAAGYGPLPLTTMVITPDQALDLALPPLDNLVQNGSFEAGTQPSNWTSTGTLPVAVTTAEPHTGDQALELGQECAAPCLDSESTWANGAIPAIAIDRVGSTHLVWTQLTSNGERSDLYYSYRPRGGVWSVPALIASDAAQPQISIDGQGTLHAIWIHLGGNLSLIYSRLSPGGTWSAPEALGYIQAPAMGSDDQGVVHIVYSCYKGQMATCYIQRSISGAWTAPLEINVDSEQTHALAVAPNGTVYVIWANNTQLQHEGIFTQTRLPDGTWTPQAQISHQIPSYIQIGVDAQANLYAFWFERSQGFFSSRSPGDQWLPPVHVPQITNGGPMVVDKDGTVHLFKVGQLGYYYRKEPHKLWSDGVQVTSSPIAASAIATNGDGQLAFAWGDSATTQTTMHARTVALVTTNARASISQSMTIPSDMHAPTLAFMYALHGVTAASNSRLSVVVGSPQLGSQAVFSTTTSLEWTHHWIDMQPWAGQLVSITVTLDQASSEPSAHLLLDDVSLGSWQTPIIRQVTPKAIVTPSEQTVLTITGDNFLATPSVYLGTTALANVQLLDDHTVQATVSAGMKPGHYDLWVVNPAGQSAIRPNLLVGREVYMSTVLR